MPTKGFERKIPTVHWGQTRGTGGAALQPHWGHWECTETQEETTAAIRQRKAAWPEVGAQWSVLVDF